MEQSQPLPPPGFPTAEVIEFISVTLDYTGKIIDRLNHTAEIFVEDLGNDVLLTMVKIPTGEFLMGSPRTEAKRFDAETPQHLVRVPEFYMGQTLVTQAQWQQIMGNNPSYFTGDGNLPVEQVSWHDTREFSERLSQATRREYRLPSEAEWEYACQGGTDTSFYSHTPFHCGESITTELANYNGNSTYAKAPQGLYRERTTPGGTFPPNAFGLYDMHGNLCEWCLDSWHHDYRDSSTGQAPTDGSAWIDYGHESKYVIRGGSWIVYPANCRSAFRVGNFEDERSNIIGFRVVCSPAIAKSAVG